ncbi:MAG: hypothetical protein U5L01_14580 [Rheinheimera sp.]|nr:hypothetical protein [Rheinheimera sp.]
MRKLHAFKRPGFTAVPRFNRGALSRCGRTRYRLRELSSKKSAIKTSERKDDASLFYFSDEYEGYQFDGGTISYVQPGEDPQLAKNLKRGEVQPGVLLDLHGLTPTASKN